MAQLASARPLVRKVSSSSPGHIKSLFQLLSFTAFCLALNTINRSIDGEMGLKWAHRRPQVYQLLLSRGY